jgi:hypothetical protein
MMRFAVIEATADEVAAGALEADRHADVVASLRDFGGAVILGATDLAQCDHLRAAMLESLPRAEAQPRALEVPGHVQHTPPTRADALYRDILVNPIAMSVSRELLGDLQLALYTGNTMLGSTTQQQPVHWDDPQLWATAEGPLPPASVTINIPLQDVTLANGALEVWPGTHHDPRSAAQHRERPFEVPLDWVEDRRRNEPPVRVELPKGALFLRDGRMWHRGTTNSTSEPRVMVAVCYHPRWFRPMVIDFHDGAQDAVRSLGIPVMARYRTGFDDQVWPPNAQLVPKPL